MEFPKVPKSGSEEKSFGPAEKCWGVRVSQFDKGYISRNQDSSGEMADYIGRQLKGERVSLTYLIAWKWLCLTIQFLNSGQQ